MQKSFEVTGPVAVSVWLAAGEIEVDPTLDGRVEVELTARDDEARQQVDAARVEVRDARGGSEVIVEVPQRRGGFRFGPLFGRGKVECRIRCPEGTDLKTRTRSADVHTRGRLGKVEVVSASGDIELGEVAADLIVKTASGDASTGAVGGRASIATASGDVSLEAAGSAVDANSASGDLRIGSVGGDVRMNTASGDLTVLAIREGSVHVNSASGDVLLGIRRGSRVHLDCTTATGDAHSELEPSGDEPEGDGPFVELRARTMSGDIRVTRAPAENALAV